MRRSMRRSAAGIDQSLSAVCLLLRGKAVRMEPCQCLPTYMYWDLPVEQAFLNESKLSRDVSPRCGQ